MSESGQTQEELYAALLRIANNPDLFAGYNGIRIIEISPQGCVGELTVTPASCNPYQIVHGGCLTTLADTVAGTNAVACGYTVVTLNCTLHFLRPATGSFIRCSSRPVKIGKTVAVIHCSLTDEKDNEVACGDFSFFILGEFGDPSHK